MKLKTKMIMVVILTTSLFGKEADPNGWLKARWGMTQEQVKKAFAGDIPSIITLGRYKWEYSVNFIYDDKGKLDEVLIEPVKKNGMGGNFSDLASGLKEKYGKPEIEEYSGRNRGRLIWNFKTTEIQLRFVEVIIEGQDYKPTYPVIYYRKAGKSPAGSSKY